MSENKNPKKLILSSAYGTVGNTQITQLDEMSFIPRTCDRYNSDDEFTHVPIQCPIGYQPLDDMSYDEVQKFVPTQNIDENPSGWDLRANVDEPVIVPPKGAVKVGVGFKVDFIALNNYLNMCSNSLIELEPNVRPRSSLSDRFVYVILGTIDVDYQGEMKIHIINLSDEPFVIERYQRIAQLILNTRINNKIVTWMNREFSESNRKEKGFGSSGKF